MESRDEMLARHARELAELEPEWWEEWFTEDPASSCNWYLAQYRNTHFAWLKKVLPTIIRKREMAGVTIWRERQQEGRLWVNIRGVNLHGIDCEIEKLAGRTLAPGEKVEI